MKRGLVWLGVLLLSGPAPAWAEDEPEPICTRPEIVDFVGREVRQNSPYAQMLTDTIGERPSQVSAVVLCAVTVVHRDFDYIKYRTQTWAEDQEYTVRWLAPGYEVTMRAPVRQ